MDSTNTTADVMRLVGVMAVCVGVAWALQILGFGTVSAFNRLMWVLAAASVAGAGVGTIFVATNLRSEEAPARI